MVAREIKKLMEDLYIHYNNLTTAEYLKCTSRGKKKLEYEEEECYELGICNEIATKIINLKPSKYMINKYPELEDIINYNFL